METNKKVKLLESVLTEAKVGIQHYISEEEPFFGIIKHRYSDFHVHEVDKNGAKVHLLSIQAPSAPVVEAEVVIEVEVGNGSMDLETLLETPGFSQSIQSLLDKEVDSIETKIIEEKVNRTAIHQKAKLIPLDSKTTPLNTIIMTRKSGGKNYRDRPRRSWAELGEYLHFTLYKENKDTMDAVSLLARTLKAEPKNFSYCGTKDKRGITSQRVSVLRMKAEHLVRANKSLRGIKVGDFHYQKEKLKLGDNKGNHFVIALRNVQVTTEKVVEEALKSLKTKGFINYFGMQRFGSRSTATSTIGQMLLAEKYKEACESILGKDNEDLQEDSLKARDLWLVSKDAKAALDVLPRFCLAERAILTSLAKQIDYLQAIQRIPKNLRSMYVHAYQSRVWNEMTSIRHKKFGLKVVIGDLVRLEESDDLKRGVGAVKVLLTQEDCKNVSIYDVVLPQPGHSVLYPSYLLPDYIDFMAKDGFHPEKMARKLDDFNLPGFYRACYSLPSDVSGKFIPYDDSDQIDFIESDWDRLQKVKISPTKPTSEEHRKLALVVEFTLGSSEYATMALRELTKSETSSSYQARLSS